MRKIGLVAAKFAVSVGLLYLATRHINLELVKERLSRISASWLLVALLAGLLQIVIGAIRWRRLIMLCGAVITLGQAFRFNMISAFFNQVLPSTIGGDAARIMLAGRTGAGWRKAAYSVLLDRFIGVLTLSILVTAGLYWSLALIENPIGRLVLLLAGLGGIAGGVTLLAIGSWKILARWEVTRHLSEMSQLACRTLLSPDTGPPILLLSVLIHLTTVTIVWAAARAIAAQLGYFDAFLLTLPVTLISTIPISIAGWGVRESALMLAFSYAGLSTGDGLMVSVLMGMVMFAIGIAGGVTWLASSNDLRVATAFNVQPPRAKQS
jgi:uncharacterized membrane protein YbhN (UPF0104 family)